MSAPALHARSVAAVVAAARAHELAAAVLRTRNPAASKSHADLAAEFRAKASSTGGGA